MRAPVILFLYVTIAASLQVRLFDVWGVASPPDLVLVPLLLVASPSRRQVTLFAALWGGLLIALLTGGPAGATSLAMVLALFLGAALRGPGGAGWLRRVVLVAVGIVVFELVQRLLSGFLFGDAGDQGSQLLRWIVDGFGAGFGALAGVRRRAALERRISARA